MEDWRQDRVGSALRGQNPTVMRRLPSGFAVIGDMQHFVGYSVLITDDPAASTLTDLSVGDQESFLADAALLARAVESVMRRRDPAYRRINLEVQGNTDAFLHAHVTPRFTWEPEPYVRWPSSLTWRDQLPDAGACALGPQHDELRADLGHAIDAEMSRTGRRLR